MNYKSKTIVGFIAWVALVVFLFPQYLFEQELPFTPDEVQAWMSQSTTSLYTAECEREIARSEFSADCCIGVNVLNKEKVTVLKKDPNEVWWDSLILAALPKAGSTTLRSLVPKIVPSYLNQLGQPKGEENSCIQCDISQRLSHKDPVTTSAIFVREPFDRFMSGTHEILGVHCDQWVEWRTQTGRPDDRLIVTQVKNTNPSPHRKCWVSLNGRPAAPWFDSTVWPATAKALLSDVRAGFRNIHINEQASKALNFPVPLDALLYTGNQTQLRMFFAQADLLDSATRQNTVHRPSSHKPSAHIFDEQMWEIFCALYIADYYCLGFTLPPRCDRYVI